MEGLLVLAGVVRLVVGTVRIGRRTLRQPLEAVSELQARQWLCQLRQQLGLFFRHFFCAPPQPSVAVLLPLLVVHDHLWSDDAGAVWLRDWNWAASCTAIGSASTRQVTHGGVLLYQVGRERVRNSNCLFENKPDCRGCSPRDAKGRMRFEVFGVARKRACTWTVCRRRAVGESNKSLLLLGWVDRPCALEVWYATETIRGAS
jgi:hypothetical protein